MIIIRSLFSQGALGSGFSGSGTGAGSSSKMVTFVPATEHLKFVFDKKSYFKLSPLTSILQLN